MSLNIYNKIVQNLLIDCENTKAYGNIAGYDTMSIFVTWEIVQASPDKPWNYLFLSFNNNITMEIINRNLDKPWCYDTLAIYANITDNEILSNPQLFGNYALEMRTFDRQRNNYLEQQNNKNQMREHFNNYIRIKFCEWFKRSALKEELIAKLWHPKNFEKFKYYDPETFDEELN
jgi:hypothetical protein